MSWYLNESNIKLNTAKRKIISSLLINNYELISICFTKLYTAGATNKQWLYTGLEGGLTLVIDYRRKTARFLLFDLNSLEIIFENEFYKKFNIFYSSLSPTFQCFEVSGGFIGFSIPDKYDSDKFFKAVTSLTDQTIARKTKEMKITSISDIKASSKKMLTLLQEKLNEEYFFKENLAYEKSIEFDFQNLEKIFDSIEFDNNTKTFSIEGNDEEMRDLVLNLDGIKFKNDKDERISDYKAYVAEMYKNFQTSEIISKKNERSNNESNSYSASTNDKKNTAKEVKKEEKKEVKKEVKKDEKKEVKKEEKKDDGKTEVKRDANGNLILKTYEAKPIGTNAKNVPKPPPCPGIPSVPKPPSIPGGPLSIPGGPPSIPGGPPSIPGGPPSIPTQSRPPLPFNPGNLMSAIRATGENKNFLKKAPVTVDKSKPMISNIDCDNIRRDNNDPVPVPNNNKISDINDNEEKKQAPIRPPPMDMKSQLKMRMENRNKINLSENNNITSQVPQPSINQNNIPINLKPSVMTNPTPIQRPSTNVENSTSISKSEPSPITNTNNIESISSIKPTLNNNTQRPSGMQMPTGMPKPMPMPIPKIEINNTENNDIGVRTEAPTSII